MVVGKGPRVAGGELELPHIIAHPDRDPFRESTITLEAIYGWCRLAWRKPKEPGRLDNAA
jgi:hypothetical protein